MSENLEKEVHELFETLASIKDAKLLKDLFEDLCTFKEVDSMAQRLKAAKLLSEGATYEEVIKETEISSATLSRVSKALKYGKGYKALYKKSK